jgi:hypothetical protein
MAKQVQPDVVQIDRYQGEVIELDRKIYIFPTNEKEVMLPCKYCLFLNIKRY